MNDEDFKEQVRLGNEAFAVLERKRTKFKKSWLRKILEKMVSYIRNKFNG